MASSHELVVAARIRYSSYVVGQLTGPTQARYLTALADFEFWLRSHALDFSALTPEDRDFVLSKYILDEVLDDQSAEGIGPASDIVAALQKRYPHHRLRASFRVDLSRTPKGHCRW